MEHCRKILRCGTDTLTFKIHYEHVSRCLSLEAASRGVVQRKFPTRSFENSGIEMQAKWVQRKIASLFAKRAERESLREHCCETPDITAHISTECKYTSSSCENDGFLNAFRNRASSARSTNWDAII